MLRFDTWQSVHLKCVLLIEVINNGGLLIPHSIPCNLVSVSITTGSVWMCLVESSFKTGGVELLLSNMSVQSITRQSPHMVSYYIICQTRNPPLRGLGMVHAQTC